MTYATYISTEVPDVMEDQIYELCVPGQLEIESFSFCEGIAVPRSITRRPDLSAMDSESRA